jgi:hypothetical protein
MNQRMAIPARARRGRQHALSKAAMAFLVAASGLLFIASPVFAQEKVVRGQTVMQRPRPDYDAKGVQAGGFTLYPLLDLSETYDDNIFATPTGEVDDFITDIRPALELRSNWSRHQLSIGGYGLFHIYGDRSDQNNQEYGATAELRLDLAKDSSLSAEGNFDRNTGDRFDPEEAGRAEPEQVDVASASVTYTKPFVNLHVTLGGDFTDYSEVSQLDKDKDRAEFGGHIRIGYDLSPSINAFVQPYYTMRDFDRAVDTFGVNRDSSVYGGGFGVAYDITGILYGETTVGYYHTNFRQAGFADDHGIGVSSSTTWNVTSLTSVIVRVSRANVITNENPAASSRKRLALNGQIQHELTRNLLVGADGGYTRDAYLGTSRVDKTFNAGAKLTFLIDNHFSLFAQYEYRDRTSSDPTAEFTDNRVILGFRAKV